jgi:Arc/MetJ family transcription regulator
MATNLALDNTLVDEARRVGNHKSKKEAVNAALSEYIARHKQLEILDYFGKLEYDKTYNYKKSRSRK